MAQRKKLSHKNYAQTFASRKLSCTRHSINKFILCTRLHELSSTIPKNTDARFPKSFNAH